MNVRIETLRAAINTLLDHAREVHGDMVELSPTTDLYWFVPREGLRVCEEEPAELTLGSLADDWAELAAIAEGRKEPFGPALVWASTVLRVLGDETL